MQESELSASHLTSPEVQRDPQNGPYLPPERVCYVCGEGAWAWNGQRYVCTGSPRSAQLHADYEQFSLALHQRYFGGQ